METELAKRITAVAAAFLLFLPVAGCTDSSVEESAPEPDAIGSDPIRPYEILRRADYVEVTGCSGGAYDYALQHAVNFLVFVKDAAPDDELIGPNDDDMAYTRRHSRELFGPLFRSADDATAGTDDHCLYPALERIGRELGFPEDAAEEDHGNIERPPVAFEYPESDVTVFEILPREDYMRLTECLVSPATYHKFHLAFFEAVLGWDDGEDAVLNMRAFLQEVGEGRHTDDGMLDSRCLHPSISVLADDLNLLNDDGQFVLE